MIVRHFGVCVIQKHLATSVFKKDFLKREGGRVVKRGEKEKKKCRTSTNLNLWKNNVLY